MQKTLTDFERIIKKKLQEDEKYQGLKWELTSENICELLKARAIDRNYAIYLLKTIFYGTTEDWKSIEERLELIKYTVEISKKNEELAQFLESIYLTEYHYQVRLDALLYLSEHFPKRANKIFKFSGGKRTGFREGFIYYIFNKYGTSKLLPLCHAIDDPLMKIFISNKDNLGWGFYYNIGKKWIANRNKQSIILINPHKDNKLKRFKTIKTLSNKEILKLPVRSFVSVRYRRDNQRFSWIWKFDEEKKNPQIVFFEEKSKIAKFYYTMSKKFFKEFIENLKKELSLEDNDFKYVLAKTMTIYYYLILEIKKINLYMKYHLSRYEVTNVKELEKLLSRRKEEELDE